MTTEMVRRFLPLFYYEPPLIEYIWSPYGCIQPAESTTGQQGEKDMKKTIKLLEEYMATLRNGRLTDFEAKAIYAKIKHYITILKKVDALTVELNK